MSAGFIALGPQVRQEGCGRGKAAPLGQPGSRDRKQGRGRARPSGSRRLTSEHCYTGAQPSTHEALRAKL